MSATISSIAVKLLRFTFFAAVAYSAFALFYTGFDGDKKYLFTLTGEWLGGRKLYTDLIEVNPPMAMLLYALPIALSRAIPLLENYEWVTLFVFALVALVTWLSLQLMRTQPQGRGVAPLVLLLFVLLVLPHPTFFADREHLFLLLTLPYFIRFSPSVFSADLPRWQRVSLSVLAALGFCIKPHTLVFFLPVQLFTMIRARSLKPVLCLENFAVCGLGAAFLLLFYALAPEYFTQIIPMALEFYTQYRAKPVALIMNLALPLFGLAIVLIDIRPKRIAPFAADISYWFMLVLCGLAYALINNGWAYTYLPLESFIAMLGGWLFIAYAGQGILSGMRSVCVALALFTAMSLGYMHGYVAGAMEQGRDLVDEDPVFLKKLGAEIEAKNVHSFAGYSAGFSHWFNLTQHYHVQFDNTLLHLWMLDAVTQEKPGSGRAYAYMMAAVRRDLERQPELVFFDTSPYTQTGTPNPDLLMLFEKDPGFASAFTAYRLRKTVSDCADVTVETNRIYCSYAIYERRP